MGLTISYFYSLTLRQFLNIQKGWSDKRDADAKMQMVLTRKMMFAALSPWGKNLTEEKVWPFDWENEQQEQRTEAETAQMEKELEASKKRWAERDARMLKSKQKTT